MRARLLDRLGYLVDEVGVPTPIAVVLAWGDRAFLLDASSVDDATSVATYHEATLYVVPDTATHRGWH